MDQKRINGPDSSFSYKNHSHVKYKIPDGHIQDIFDERGFRKDRKNNESRKMCKFIFPFILNANDCWLCFPVLKSGVVSQAKGSGYIELGNTKVLVSVFDPREIPKQNHYWYDRN
jgi:exosome complex component MTR3